jgi:hypothetical protein
LKDVAIVRESEAEERHFLCKDCKHET